MARVKRVVINPEAFFNVMQEATAWKVATGIPKGAKFRGFTLDPYTQCLHLFVEHESFPEMQSGEVAPQLDLYFKRM